MAPFYLLLSMSLLQSFKLHVFLNASSRVVI
uniref:Uncharacterized protein n=2 Tax=unclassified bacterial viruses TaxID=12333 RepID=A0AB39C4H4_9VIRU